VDLAVLALLSLSSPGLRAGDGCASIDSMRTTGSSRRARWEHRGDRDWRPSPDEWATITADERKRILAAIFESVTTTADGVDRLEPCEDWRHYVVAAIPKPVKVPNDPDRGHRSGRRGSSTRSW
jgi:hypothetical protein